MDLITYALAQQAIAQYGASDAQIDNIKTNENNELIITLTDGREFKVQIPTVSPEVVTELTKEVSTITETVTVVTNQVESLGLALANTSSKVLALDKDVIALKETKFVIGDTKVSIVDGEINLPLASGDVVGLVMAKVPNSPIDSVNSISINNETGYLEVNSLSIDKLYQDKGDTLILDCSQTF